MDKEKIPKNGSGEISRREFLKDAGLVVGGAAIGSAVLLAACAPKEGATATVTSPPVTKTQTTTVAGPTTTQTVTVEVPMTFPVSKGYLVVDQTKCSGCQSCMLACSLVHEGSANTSLARIQMSRTLFSRFPDDIVLSICRQCVDPACVRSCLFDACYVDTENGNVRVIDEEKCTGCGLCIDACPHIPHRTIWNAEKNKATKCDLCINTPYWDEQGGPGGKQACVEICTQKAIAFVTEVPSQEDNEGYDVNLREEA